MYGAILGDIAGSPYEFDRGHKTKDFPLFGPESNFTDDSVMTVAVMWALLRWEEAGGKEDFPTTLTRSLQQWGKRYPHAGYGTRFRDWLQAADPRPYGSYGNGSAMRVSPVAWWFDDLPLVLEYAKKSAAVTHDHPEGIKGAQATAAAIFLARRQKSKDEIRAYVTENFGYDLSRTCDEIRPHYRHVESCQETVPEAITAFLESTSFEDALRTAVSLGGDCDTLTAITASIAEAFYGTPGIDFLLPALQKLDPPLLAAVGMFDCRLARPRLYQRVS